MTEELHPLEMALLTEQIRTEQAKAEKAEIDLAILRDAERDRLVKSGRIRHLYLNGVIAGANADAWLDALVHWDRRDPGQAVDVTINSPGGVITDGLAIYDQLLRMRRAGTHVTTLGTGAVMSMAAVLLQAGDVRRMDRNATLLLHEGSSNFSGNLTVGEQEDAKKYTDLLIGRILDIMAERSTLTKRSIATRWKRRDWHLTADEALKMGFVDEIA
jgi:ATP-dependent Clp protease protease subunit